MSEAPGDASVAPVVSRDDIERLSALYDGFVNAFDPFAAARDAAEVAFIEKSLFVLIWRASKISK